MQSVAAGQPEIRVAFVGIGRVGKDVARLIMRRPGFRAVGAQSRNKQLWGKPLDRLLLLRRRDAPRVTGSLDRALEGSPDIVVIATTSFLDDVLPVVTACVKRGCNVVCTAEEMAFPWAIDPAAAAKLDRLAKRHAVTVLGAGANPGFITDALVLTAAGAAWEISSISTRRVVKLGRFSLTVLRRLGIGYTKRDFTTGIRSSRIFGHIGYPESIGIVARALGKHVSHIRKSYRPLIADRDFQIEHMTVRAGLTAGFVQRAQAIVGGAVWFDAEFIGHVDPMAAGYEPQDQIRLFGTPDLNLSVNPGFDPQFTSAAVIANSLRRVVQANPGLVTVADLPPAVPSPTRD